MLGLVVVAMKRRCWKGINVRVSGLVHHIDNDETNDVRMTYCWAFKNSTTRYVRSPVTCVACLAIAATGEDPWDARRTLGDRTSLLWMPKTQGDHE